MTVTANSNTEKSVTVQVQKNSNTDSNRVVTGGLAKLEASPGDKGPLGPVTPTSDAAASNKLELRLDRAKQIHAICERRSAEIDCDRLQAMAGEALFLKGKYPRWSELAAECQIVAERCKTAPRSVTGFELDKRAKEILGTRGDFPLAKTATGEGV